MVNIWNQYQCMVTFNMSRSASYYESGTGRGMGFRDSCQDLLGFVHLIPDSARQRILDIAATQFEDGSAYHQYQPLTKKGNSDIGSGFNDDPLWLIAGTAAYLKETGDFSILDEKIAFDCDTSKAQPLMEHLRRSFNYTTTHLGPHKLPLIGRADWNDCLNLNCFSSAPGESFQTTGPSEGPVAESVFIAGMCLIIWGLVTQGWYMNEISAVFLAMGLLAGVIAGFSQDVIAQEFVAGIADFAFSAIVVGLARGILVIASDGMIIDTILNALATGLGGIPAVLFTTLLYAVENLLAILVPSSSGLAALTAPIFGPLTELMGLNPEAAVWALSMGSATMSLICPTSAILVAGLGVCKIKLGQWWKTVWKFFLVVSLINIVFVAISGLIAL